MGDGRRKEKGTDGRRSLWSRLSRRRRGGTLFLAAPVAVGAFDVALTVERGAPGVPGDGPGLAVTGAPLLVLIALLALVVAIGVSALVEARRREAHGRGG